MSVLSDIEPAISKYAERDFPIEPDIYNGWHIKVKGFRQISVRYLYPPVDSIVKEYTQLKQKESGSGKYRIVYLGPRGNTNLKVIRAYCQKEYDVRVKEGAVYGEGQLRKYQYQRHKEKDITEGLLELSPRIFIGMNPTIHDDQSLIFDSDFECGNLDLAVRVSQNQYDLFMRVDSNTRGHTSWYFFKLKNTRKNQKIKFNVCNFHKKSTLYGKGMRPYMWNREESGKGWRQTDVSELTYERKGLRYKNAKEHVKPFYCLSFTYQFQYDFDEVYFCYGIPYSYSFLINFLDSLISNPQTKSFLRMQKKYQSASGLTIPLLTITNPSPFPPPHPAKKIILITARLHPGQTQGSWVLHGFIRFLCSPEAQLLRNIAVFKIIPMVNVDGVIAGNFRTSLRGADLNRKFKTQGVILKDDEVGWVKNLAYQYTKIIHTYIDFHGHSSNKNAFIYGPQYPMNHQHYLPSRLFPKMIDKSTQMFRYYSCNFRISKNKETTARAIMLKQNRVPFCFTVETSNYGYYSRQKEGEVEFDREGFVKLGEIIGRKSGDWIGVMGEIEGRKQEMRVIRKKRGVERKETKLNFFASKTLKMEMKKTVKERVIIARDEDKQMDDTNNAEFNMQQFLNQVYSRHNLSDMREEIELQKKQQNDQQLKEGTQSESSDYESQTEDYTPEELLEFVLLSKPPPLNKSISPLLTKIIPTHKKKRSASYRLPPPQPPKQLIFHKQRAISPKTISISSQNSQLFTHKPFLVERDKIRDKSHRLRDLLPPANSRSKTKIPSITRMETMLLGQKSRELRSQNFSMDIKQHMQMQKIQQQVKEEIFIYKHVKMLVFPELMKQPTSSKCMKGGYQRREKEKEREYGKGVTGGVESGLRKELIERRGGKRGGIRISMGEIDD